MSLHNLFTQAGRDRARRRFRLRLARRGLGLPGSVRRGLGLPGSVRRGLSLPGRPRREPACSARAAARSRRRLAAIDRGLARETPRLASMFAMFNALAAAEPVRAERLPSRARPRLGLAQAAVLATLAAIVALCVVLSTQAHSVLRPCPASAAASSSASPPTSSSGSASASPPASPFASSSASASASAPASPFAPPSASAAAGQAGAGSGLAAIAAVRSLSCQAYAAPNK